MDEQTDEYVTILGSSLSLPIVALLDQLYRSPYMGTTDVQSSSFEHGHSAALCLLLAILLESYVVRARHITHQSAESGIQRNALRYLETVYSDLPEMDEIREVFVLRDVIAHNHLWRVTVSAERGRHLELRSKELDDLAGDEKFRDCVDLESATTLALGLNTLPTKLERSDVVKVLGVVVRTLRFLNSRESGRLAISGLRGNFLGEDLDLWEIEERIRQAD